MSAERWIPAHTSPLTTGYRRRPVECLLPGDCGFCLVDAARRAGTLGHQSNWNCRCPRCKDRRARWFRAYRARKRAELAGVA